MEQDKNYLKIKLIKSLIKSKKKQNATAESLKLRKIGDETVQPDNFQTVGKINKIKHLVEFIKINKQEV